MHGHEVVGRHRDRVEILDEPPRMGDDRLLRVWIPVRDSVDRGEVPNIILRHDRRVPVAERARVNIYVLWLCLYYCAVSCVC